MKKFTKLTSVVAPLDLSNIDTDIIISSEHLLSTHRQGYGQYVFSELRSSDSEFILTKDEYIKSEILLVRDNFGCGSSREQAVWALMEAGIKVIICASFPDIFSNNAAKNGLLLISIAEVEVDTLFVESNKKALTLTVDLEKQTIEYNSESINFNYDIFQKDCLLNGVDQLDYLYSNLNLIKQYEKKHKIFLNQPLLSDKE